MKHTCLLVLYLALPLVAARAAGDGSIAKSVYELSPALQAARDGLPPADLPNRLAAVRQEMLAYTRTHLAGTLGRGEWLFPAYMLFNWSSDHGFRNHQEAHADLSEWFALLQEAPPHNREVATSLLATMALFYSQRWLDTEHGPDALALIDRIEDWALSDPASGAFWHERTWMLPAHVLLAEGRFAPETREDLLRNRHGRLLRFVTDETVHPTTRTRAVAQFANALYLTGKGEKANTWMQQWWRRTEGRITCQSFFTIWMKILLYENADIERAGRLLEHINTLEAPRASDRRHQEQAAAFYYNALQLPDYEIRRLRTLQKTTWQQQQDRNRAAVPPGNEVR